MEVSAISPCRLARASLIVLAGAAALAAAAFAATWYAGARAWPEAPGEAPARIASNVEALRRAPGDRSRRVVVIGDVQNGLSELADVLDEARRRGADLLLFLGDCADVGRPARYAVLRHVIREHAPGVPVLAVPGNHDIPPDGRRDVWEKWVGPAVWRADLDGWRILGLDDAEGPLTLASAALLAEAAREAGPTRRTILLAHRPLAGETPSKSGMETRMRQLAATGVGPVALTLCAHWHRNEDWTDATGARHLVLGETCDRAAKGGEADPSALTLTLGDGMPGVETWRVPRRRHVREEFLRLAVGSVYAPFHGRPLAAASVLVGLSAVAAAAAVAAFRRPRTE